MAIVVVRPSPVLREVGAHFVIAANVVPPPPASAPVRLDLRSLVTWLPRKIVERLEDTVRGVFVLGWKAGEDQGALAADYTLDLLPTVANLFEMWRGRAIVEEIAAGHFEGENKTRIREAWDRFRGHRAPSHDRVACSTSSRGYDGTGAEKGDHTKADLGARW